MVGRVLILRNSTRTFNAVFGVLFSARPREAANLGKKLHLKVWRIDGETQLSLFFKLIQNSPTCGRVARVGAIGGPFGQQDIMI